MKHGVSGKTASTFIGKQVHVLKKDGTVASGKLVRISGGKLYLAAPKGKARVSAIAPLVLFDLLAIGTAPYAYGAYGGYPGYYGGYGPGIGYGGYGPGLGYGGYPLI